MSSISELADKKESLSSPKGHAGEAGVITSSSWGAEDRAWADFPLAYA